MGVCTATSTSFIPFTPEQVYDFITNPHNWPKTYKGSAGMQQDLNIPIQPGEEWVETVRLGDNIYYSKWNLKTAIKPMKWVFLQTNGIGATDKSCSNGHDGITEIAYHLERSEIDVDGKRVQGCLFRRTLTIDLPRGTSIPDDLLAVCMKTAGIEGYHDAVIRELQKENGAA
ncbi:uncharacterized protein RCC_09011 [Ramularia collo-cygni]|uniref:Uncharacterized protein n=1 Tax=Ramularia collo-cygni TaxID=112498 RepID=A0A2D3V8Q3_9PEZI|nr:uncharacterized protein RCC_09011 [Ramularia collo-cygni]CZT23300.1 uncharacterized protein RCC_09011 [Ramularia collo-cygni]